MTRIKYFYRLSRIKWLCRIYVPGKHSFHLNLIKKLNESTMLLIFFLFLDVVDTLSKHCIVHYSGYDNY